MQKFRKKVIELEAVQWFKDGDHPLVVVDENGQGRIQTDSGLQTVNPGDWIIAGLGGEHYPLCDAKFKVLYEPVPVGQ